MFGLTNRGELNTPVESEFEQLISKLRGFLLAEHNEDGTHSHITAKSIITTRNSARGETGDATIGGDLGVEGTIDANGNITAASATTPVEIGGALGNSSSNPGMRITQNANVDWAVVMDQGVFSGAPAMLWHDIPNKNTSAGGFLGIYRSSAVNALPAEYHAVPPASTIDLYLGDDASGRRWAEVNTRLARATSGYYERFRIPAVGTWTTPTFAAGNFTGVGGTWTVTSDDIATFAYMRVGLSMTLMFEIETTAVGAGVTDLSITLPASVTCAKATRVPFQAINNSVASIGIARAQAGGTVLLLQSSVSGGGWTDTGGATTTAVRGQITFETTT